MPGVILWRASASGLIGVGETTTAQTDQTRRPIPDTEEGLREIIGASFEQVELKTLVSFAILSATGPRTNSSVVAVS